MSCGFGKNGNKNENVSWKSGHGMMNELKKRAEAKRERKWALELFSFFSAERGCGIWEMSFYDVNEGGENVI